MNDSCIYVHPTSGRRIGAFIIDYTIIIMLAFIPFLFLPGLLHTTPDMRFVLIMMFIQLCGILLKDVFGRSIGKILFGIYIVHGDAPDLRVSTWQRILRNIPLLFAPIELIYTFSYAYDRRLGDKWAHTLIAEDTKKRRPSC